jgi:glycosyltransferase involved in cell wall biosynthesis
VILPTRRDAEWNTPVADVHEMRRKSDMRVLVVTNTEPHSGGVALHVDHIVSAMRRAGIEIEILWQTSLARRLPGSLSGIVFGLQALWKAYRTRPDLVHAHCADGYALRPALGIPYVMTSHGDERPSLSSSSNARNGVLHVTSRNLRRMRFSRAVRTANDVIALHQEEARRYRSDRGARGRVHIIANGSDYHGQAIPRMNGRVIFVGNWLDRKGAKALPLIFRRVRSAVPDSELVLVGPTAEASLSFSAEDRSHVSALGWLSRNEVEFELSKADCLVVPSLAEGMPLVVLDAMACGVPVIGSDLPGIASAAGAAALLFSPDDWQSMGDAIIRVISDRILNQTLSSQGLSRAADFRWSVIARATLEVYASAVGEPASSEFGQTAAP